MIIKEVRPIKSFVHLAYGFGSKNWRARWSEGRVLGINEPQAYGYHHADSVECQVVYSEDMLETRVQKLLRLGMRAVLGFDFLHVWRNRKALLSADVVWTHTESQTLAVLALLRIIRPMRSPKVIGQVVWLIDRWSRNLWPRQMLFRWLLRRLDLMTVHSVLNLQEARLLFPFLRVEQVRFGIRADEIRPPLPRIDVKQLRLAALGSDEHRDWKTLASAMRQIAASGTHHVTLRVGSRSAAAHKAMDGVPNAAVIEAKTNLELLDLYDTADLVVVPLTPNLHVSGITVIEEALLRGVAVVASDVGGLRDYFDDSMICYVPMGNVRALTDAILQLGTDAARRQVMVEAGQKRIQETINSRCYAQRHVDLSRDLLGTRAPLPEKPRIAIGIATSGRPAILAALIDDLARQTLRPDVIFISYAQESDISEIRRDAWPEGMLRFINGAKGTAAQRNTILNYIEDEDLLAFFDDDFFLHPDYLAEMAQAFHKNPLIVGATGRVLADGAKSPGLSVAFAKEMIDQFVKETFLDESQAIEGVFNTYGCNMIFRLDVVRESGVLFDERLALYGWYEDIDFSRALSQYGHIMGVNRAVGVHLGNKGGKTSGLRLGYSQVCNPIYLALKGTYSWKRAIKSISRHLCINLIKSIRPESYVDRRGRVCGNIIAIFDIFRGNITPERIIDL